MRPTLPRITPGVQDHVSLVSYPAGMFIARCALALDLPRCNMRVRWRACRRSGSVAAGARPHRLRKRQRLDAHAHALCAASARLRMPVSACHWTPRAPQRADSHARAAQRRAARGATRHGLHRAAARRHRTRAAAVRSGNARWATQTPLRRCTAAQPGTRAGLPRLGRGRQDAGERARRGPDQKKRHRHRPRQRVATSVPRQARRLLRGHARRHRRRQRKAQLAMRRIGLRVMPLLLSAAAWLMSLNG